jgi:hypothetical protein
MAGLCDGGGNQSLARAGPCGVWKHYNLRAWQKRRKPIPDRVLPLLAARDPGNPLAEPVPYCQLALTDCSF